MLSNPAPILYQNLRIAMENGKEDKPAKEKGGLLGPKNTMAQRQDKEDALSPTRRVASYAQLLQQKREEV